MSVIKEYLVLYLSFSNVTKQKFLGSLFFDLSIGLITSETVPNWKEQVLRKRYAKTKVAGSSKSYLSTLGITKTDAGWIKYLSKMLLDVLFFTSSVWQFSNIYLMDLDHLNTTSSSIIEATIHFGCIIHCISPFKINFKALLEKNLKHSPFQAWHQLSSPLCSCPWFCVR